jgi:hypothetical protein
MDRRGVADQVARLPLAGFAPHESIEIVKPHADGPLVKRASLAGVERGRIVIFAEPACGKAVVFEDLADGRLVFGDDAVVAGVACGNLRDYTKADRVVIASGNQGSPRGRAKGRRVEVRISQAGFGNAIHIRRGDQPAECAWRSKAHIIGDDQQHIGRSLGRHDTRRPKGLGILCIEIDDAAKGRRRVRNVAAINRRRGAG